MVKNKKDKIKATVASGSVTIKRKWPVLDLPRGSDDPVIDNFSRDEYYVDIEIEIDPELDLRGQIKAALQEAKAAAEEMYDEQLHKLESTRYEQKLKLFKRRDDERQKYILDAQADKLKKELDKKLVKSN